MHALTLTTKSSELAALNSKRAWMAQKGSHSAMNTEAPELCSPTPVVSPGYLEQ